MHVWRCATAHGWVQYDLLIPASASHSSRFVYAWLTYESMLCCNARKVLWEMERKVSARPWLTVLVSEEKIVQAMSSCPQQSSGKSWIGARSKVSKLMTSWHLYLMIFIVDFLVFLHAHISQKSETLWAWGRHMPSDVPNSIEPQGANPFLESHSVSAPFALI